MINNKFRMRGRVQVRIQGQNMERFYNIVAQRELHIVEIRGEEGNGFFWTTPEDFKKMKPVAKKAGVRLRIVSRRGIPFFLYRNRRRKLLVCGLGCFFLLIYILSFYIWDISFEGNHRFTDEMLLHYMETIPVVNGARKSKISCEEIEAGIRNQFSEITWVSAEIRGTRLIVHIKENEAVIAPILSEDEPCDLVANKAGTIVKTVVRSGFCKVKEGDIVEEQMLLVDGTIPIYDDAGTLVNYHEIHADAEIYAETIHTIQRAIPFMEQTRYRTGNERKGVYLKLFDRTFFLMMPYYGEKKWEYISEETQLKILEDFYLPVYFGNICAYEYDIYEHNYTENEIHSISNDYLKEYIEKLNEKGIQILDSDGRIKKGASEWQIQGILNVIEDIAEEKKVVNECN